MILTDYFKMVHLDGTKSATRYDCVCSHEAGVYDPFDFIRQRARNKRFFFHLTKAENSVKAQRARMSDMSITNSTHISSVYVPDLDEHLKGYGDVRNTNDAILFLFSEDYKQIEVFIARGYKNDVCSLFNNFIDGELDEEIQYLRSNAKEADIK